MEPICRCHSCGTEVNAKNRRCPRCYVALRSATRAPAPLRASHSAAPVDGQLALAAATPAEAPFEELPAVPERCPACETTVLPVQGRCSYCHEPLNARTRTSAQPDEVTWAIDNLEPESDVDAPMAQIIAGPWLRSTQDSDIDTATARGAHDQSEPCRSPAPSLTVDPETSHETEGRPAPPRNETGAQGATDAESLSSAVASVGTGQNVLLEADQATVVPAGKPGHTTRRQARAAGRSKVATNAGPDATAEPEPEPELVPQAQLATWRQRTLASLIDVSVFLPALVVLPFSLAVGGMLLVDALVFAVWQVWFLQGRTGQTVGKNRLGIRVISAKDRLPIGPKRAAKRALAHLLDLALLAVGSKRPLRGRNRQTVADRIAGTLVVAR